MDELIWVAVALSTLLFVGMWLLKRKINTLETRINKLVGGRAANSSLENMIRNYFDKLSLTEKKLRELNQSYRYLADMAGGSFTKTGIVRFNPFGRTGGDQSFVLALLDASDNGILLTNIQGREGTRFYVKQISFGSSEHPLSDEEKQAVARAIKAQPGKSRSLTDK